MTTRPSQDNKSPPRDYRAEVTDDIIRLLEQGTAPWQRPWNAGDVGHMPFNPTTGKPYRGGNVISLMVAGMRKGYSDPRWCTYKQAQEKGWQVRHGEKASQVEFWEVKPGAAQEDADSEETRGRLVHRVYAVFNAEQMDGIPALAIKPREAWEVCDAGEHILKSSGADIRYGGAQAYYRKDTDHIQLPPREAFPNAPSFYGTASHELMHWTGSAKRLNRETLVKSRSFADESYSREELRAEIGSMMLAAELGIPHDPARHASYVASWIKALKDDKNEIFRAAADASKACDYLLQRQQEKTVEEGTHVARVRTEESPVAQRSR